MARGKYLDWITPDGLLLVEGWARDGLTDEQIARNKIGINPDTMCQWKKRFPEFAEALKKGKAPVDQLVENTLLKRALGYSYQETTTENITNDKCSEVRSKVITKHMAPDVTAQIFWLKNRRPDKWRDRPKDETDEQALAKLDKLIEEVANAAK